MKPVKSLTNDETISKVLNKNSVILSNTRITKLLVRTFQEFDLKLTEGNGSNQLSAITINRNLRPDLKRRLKTLLVVLFKKIDLDNYHCNFIFSFHVCTHSFLHYNENFRYYIKKSKAIKAKLMVFDQTQSIVNEFKVNLDSISYIFYIILFESVLCTLVFVVEFSVYHSAIFEK